MLPQERRLRKGSDFAAVAHRGRGWRDRLLTLRVLHQGTGCSRFGLVVSSSVGNAVTRNRVKRRLREILRGLSIEEGWDIVLIARLPAASTDYQTLKRVAVLLLQRGNLLAHGVTVAAHE